MIHSCLFELAVSDGTLRKIHEGDRGCCRDEEPSKKEEGLFWGRNKPDSWWLAVSISIDWGCHLFVLNSVLELCVPKTWGRNFGNLCHLCVMFITLQSE